ncbi:MAG: hypothetical protein MI919_12775, partial [Holophagales bacterium]|nr:hypothetical protein [Holophagales bacterium]
TDPDGDGTDEDLIYVDCDAGTNSPSCGAPGSPCRTIEHAWGVRADGPADGAEDIVCFRGTCSTLEAFSPPFGGVPGFYQVPATGSQVRAWRYPRDPTMLVGWDTDDDGAYPPYDSDDTAVLDGSSSTRPFRLDADTDYLQMAHFVARDFGRFRLDSDDCGFVRFGPSFDLQQYQVFHDLELLRINMDRETSSRMAMVSLFATNARPQWILFDNIQALDNGQWFARGSGYDEPPDHGPFRFQRITRTAHSCDFSVCGTNAGSTAFKLWGYLSRVEILDSVWDANVRAWEPKPFGGPSGSAFVTAAHCSQDWTIRNNLILDYKNPFRVQGYEEFFCNAPFARPTDDVVIDSNVVWNTWEPWDNGDHAIRIEDGGSSAGEMVGDVTITNNFLGSATGWEASIWSKPGHETIQPTGRIVISGNTLFGNINRHAAIAIGNVEGSDHTFLHQSYLIENNIIAGFIATDSGDKDLAIRTTYPVGDLISRNNVFDPEGELVWNDGPRRTLAGWTAETGQDGSSHLCLPALADAGSGDFHLLASDTCARGRGVVSADTPASDHDGLPRQEGALEIGADEISTFLWSDGFEVGDVGRWSRSMP